MFKTIWITTKRNLINIKIVEDTIEFLIKNNKQILLSEHARNILDKEKYKKYPPIDYSKKIDILIVFWWDWSILRANRNIENYDTKIIWINVWTLWFLSEIDPSEAMSKLEKIFQCDYKIDERTLLSIKIIRNKKTVVKCKALNEAVISYKDIARLINIIAKIDNRVLANYRSDGLIISTPTWSTAYNVSAGWPILYPKIPAFIITPLSPHSFTQKPIVLPDDKKLSFEIWKDNEEKCSLTIDWQTVHTIEQWDIIEIEKHKDTLKFIRFPREHFYKIIKKKLKWWENLS